MPSRALEYVASQPWPPWSTTRVSWLLGEFARCLLACAVLCSFHRGAGNARFASQALDRLSLSGSLLPHRGAFEKSPGEFPFFNDPRRFTTALHTSPAVGLDVICCSSLLSGRSGSCSHASCNHGLATFADLHMLHYDRLFAPGSHLLQRHKCFLVRLHHARRGIRQAGELCNRLSC